MRKAGTSTYRTMTPAHPRSAGFQPARPPPTPHSTSSSQIATRRVAQASRRPVVAQASRLYSLAQVPRLHLVVEVPRLHLVVEASRLHLVVQAARLHSAA